MITTPQKNLNELKAGDDIFHFLAVSKVEIKTAKTNKNYINLELRDKSGLISAKLWDNFENLLADLKEGAVVRIKGVVEEYLNQFQIKVDKIKLAKPEDGVTIQDFLPRSLRNPEEMKKEFNNWAAGIKNNYLKQLINNIFTPGIFEKYSTAPAGKGWHHAYIHGLIEHTLELIKICDLMCTVHSEINRDLVITGAILHDFGKIYELTYDSNFDYSDQGRLLGHIVIAASEVEKQIDKIKNFPVELKIQLLHLILSHQGKLEFASPIEPKTLEAIVLYHADELSAKANAYKNVILSEKSKGSNWTRFIPLANNALYIPNDILNNGSSNKKTD